MSNIMQIGKVRPTYKGEWDAGQAYETLDWVLYRGIAYQAIKDVPINREPDVATDYWVATGMKGDKGRQRRDRRTGTCWRGRQGRGSRIQGPKGDKGNQGIQGPKGDTGATGPQGPQGTAPEHKWAGTKLAFQNPDGSWADPVNLIGAPGGSRPRRTHRQTGHPRPCWTARPRWTTGVAGPKGTSLNLKGAWAANVAYVCTTAQIDVVTYNGSSYACKKSHTSTSSILPTNTTYWDAGSRRRELQARRGRKAHRDRKASKAPREIQARQGHQGPRGATGATGATGPQGPQGPARAAGSTSYQAAACSGMHNRYYGNSLPGGGTWRCTSDSMEDKPGGASVLHVCWIRIA